MLFSGTTVSLLLSAMFCGIYLVCFSCQAGSTCLGQHSFVHGFLCPHLCFLIYLFLPALGLRCRAWGFSLVAASRGYSSLWCTGFSLQWLLLLQSTGSRCTGFSSCGTRAQQLWLVGSRVQAQQLWCTGLVALWHVGSSRTRAQTRVSCIGRRILSHCATREAPPPLLSRCMKRKELQSKDLRIRELWGRLLPVFLLFLKAKIKQTKKPKAFQSEVLL